MHATPWRLCRIPVGPPYVRMSFYLPISRCADRWAGIHTWIACGERLRVAEASPNAVLGPWYFSSTYLPRACTQSITLGHASKRIWNLVDYTLLSVIQYMGTMWFQVVPGGGVRYLRRCWRHIAGPLIRQQMRVSVYLLFYLSILSV